MRPGDVENPMIRDQKEPKVVAYCAQCDEELREDYTIAKFDDEYFCDNDCFLSYMGVQVIEGSELLD